MFLQNSINAPASPIAVYSPEHAGLDGSFMAGTGVQGSTLSIPMERWSTDETGLWLELSDYEYDSLHLTDGFVLLPSLVGCEIEESATGGICIAGGRIASVHAVLYGGWIWRHMFDAGWR